VLDEHAAWLTGWLKEIEPNVEGGSVAASLCLQGAIGEMTLYGETQTDWVGVMDEFLVRENRPLAYSEEFGKRLYKFAFWEQTEVHAVHQGQPSQERSWILKTIRQNHYTATLSDAAGPVTGLADGSRLLLEYRVKGPLIMHQTLELMPDGKTIDNVGKITFLGIPVGYLHETITRKD
jgi:hypothetical protein